MRTLNMMKVAIKINEERMGYSINGTGTIITRMGKFLIPPHYV